MSTFKHITVSALTPVIGAEISCVDLREDLPEEVFREIVDAWIEWGVVFFRDQHITLDQHIAFGRRIGEISQGDEPRDPADDDPEVLVFHHDEHSERVRGGYWHSDFSDAVRPPSATILHVTEAPPAGGDTLFCNMYSVFEDLSPSLQDFLSGLTALYGHQTMPNERTVVQDSTKAYRENSHPVVRTHPVTGRPLLFVNPVRTVKINELSWDESNALLSFLYERVHDPRYQCRFRWRNDSIAFWDNRCTQHIAVGDYFPAVRHAERVICKGDRPR